MIRPARGANHPQKQCQAYKFVTLAGSECLIASSKLSPYVRGLFDQRQWDLSDRRFRDYRMHTVMPYIAECHITELKADYNKYPNIAKCLSYSSFTDLQHLYLGDNAIVSVESLCLVHMPELRTLHLNNNYISNVASLARCCIPKVSVISLRETLVRNDGQLQALRDLDAPKLTQLLVDYSNNNVLQKRRIWLLKTNFLATPRNRNS